MAREGGFGFVDHAPEINYTPLRHMDTRVWGQRSYESRIPRGYVPLSAPGYREFGNSLVGYDPVEDGQAVAGASRYGRRQRRMLRTTTASRPPRRVVGSATALGDYFLPNEYTRSAREVLASYGDWGIEDVIIHRQPVIKSGLTSGAVSLANAVCQNPVTGASEFFHLSTTMALTKVVREPMTNHIASHQEVFVRVEKMETVTITLINKDQHSRPELFGEDEQLNIGAPWTRKGPLSLKTLLGTVCAKMGADAFFGYDALRNNCQDFVLLLVKVCNCLVPQVIAFVKQDVSELAGKWWMQPVSLGLNALTTTGNFVKRLIPRWLGGSARMAAKKNHRKRHALKNKHQRRGFACHYVPPMGRAARIKRSPNDEEEESGGLGPWPFRGGGVLALTKAGGYD